MGIIAASEAAAYVSRTLDRLNMLFLVLMGVSIAVAAGFAVSIFGDFDYPSLTTPEASRQKRRGLIIAAICAAVFGLLFVVIHN